MRIVTIFSVGLLLAWVCVRIWGGLVFHLWDLLYCVSKSLCSSALLGSSTAEFGGWIAAVITAYVSERDLRSAGCFLSAPRTPVGPAEQRRGAGWLTGCGPLHPTRRAGTSGQQQRLLQQAEGDTSTPPPPLALQFGKGYPDPCCFV